jgi:hypothetical protein
MGGGLFGVKFGALDQRMQELARGESFGTGLQQDALDEGLITKAAGAAQGVFDEGGRKPGGECVGAGVQDVPQFLVILK